MVEFKEGYVNAKDMSELQMATADIVLRGHETAQAILDNSEDDDKNSVLCMIKKNGGWNQVASDYLRVWMNLGIAKSKPEPLFSELFVITTAYLVVRGNLYVEEKGDDAQMMVMVNYERTDDGMKFVEELPDVDCKE